MTRKCVAKAKFKNRKRVNYNTGDKLHLSENKGNIE